MKQYTLKEGTHVVLMSADRLLTEVEEVVLKVEVVFFEDDLIEASEGTIVFKLADGWDEHSGGCLTVQATDVGGG